MNLILWAWVDKLLINLAAGIYKVICAVYDAFLFLAETSIFGSDDYAPLVNNVYTILGVVVLFIMAYSILTYIVDPEKDKGGASSEKMIKNVFISFIMIILCPFVFGFAYKVQNAVLSENVIGNFFNKNNPGSVEDYLQDGGNNLAASVFQAFFTITSNDPTLESRKKYKGPSISYTDEKGITNTINEGTITLDEAKIIAERTGSFAPFALFAENIDDDEVDFNFLVCVIAGLYLGWIMVSFCFDLAVRVCKLAFYQIIAPLCIACRILPNKDSIYKNWSKATINTYLQVFILIFIMTLGMYLINIVSHAHVLEGLDFFRKAFLMLGMVTFIKSAPKLIQEVFGIGDVKLGIKDKFKEGGGFLAASAIGAGVTGLARNGYQALNKFKKTEGQSFGKRVIAAAKGLGSTVAGTASGVVHGGMEGRNAGSWSAMRSAASAGAQTVTTNKANREARVNRYQAARTAKGKTYIPGLSAVGGHINDITENIKDWGKGGAQEYDYTTQLGAKFGKLDDALKSASGKVVDKFINSTALVLDGGAAAQCFKGDTAQISAQEAMYNKLERLNGGGKFSIEFLENYRDQLKNKQINRANYTSDALYEQDLAKQAQDLGTLQAMSIQMRKNAGGIVTDNCNNQTWITSNGMKVEDLIEVQGAAKNLVETYNSTVTQVTDQVVKDSYGNNVSYGRIDPTTGNVGKQIKDRMDAIQHNSAVASQEKTRREEAAKARKGDSKK